MIDKDDYIRKKYRIYIYPLFSSLHISSVVRLSCF